MITFITEDNTIFAVEQSVEKGGKFYDELMYAEISRLEVGVKLQWEDDWQHPLYFKSADDNKELLIKSAQQYVTENYHRHTPFVNGLQFDLE